jgi:hypothetical protein
MPGVQNDPTELRRFMGALRQFNGQLTTNTNRMRSQLNNLNGVWRDAEYTKFSEELKTAMEVFDRYLRDADSYMTYLDRKAGHLERYLGR